MILRGIIPTNGYKSRHEGIVAHNDDVYMDELHNNRFPVKIVGMIIIVALFIGIANWYVRRDNVVNADVAMDSVEQKQESRPKKIVAKGLYITAKTAADDAKRAEILKLLDTTELNAVVIDIKDSTGFIQYKSSDAVSGRKIWIHRETMTDPAAIVHEFHSHNVYVIGRIVVFQDPPLAKAFPELTIKTKGNESWKDYKGVTWVDPTNTTIWEYNVAIARDAAKLGFDELNFDYVRFPSDGNLEGVKYSRTFTKRHEIMKEFFAFVSDALKNERPYLSFDLFGMVADNIENDLGIGQRIKDVKDVADYISPMMYPSHYPTNYMGIKNPAEKPYEVISHGLKIAEPQFATSSRVRLRPWIQAFNIGAVYDAKKIRAQIRAVEESHATAGWLLWNARNYYTNAGLNP